MRLDPYHQPQKKQVVVNMPCSTFRIYYSYALIFIFAAATRQRLIKMTFGQRIEQSNINKCQNPLADMSNLACSSALEVQWDKVSPDTGWSWGSTCTFEQTWDRRLLVTSPVTWDTGVGVLNVCLCRSTLPLGSDRLQVFLFIVTSEETTYHAKNLGSQAT